MSTTHHSVILPYGVAVVAVALALLVAWHLRAAVEQSAFPLFFSTVTVFPLFLLTVMLSVWSGGLGPGLFATALATVTAAALFAPTAPSPLFGLAEAVPVGVLLLSILLISSMLSARKRAGEKRAQGREALRRQETEERLAQLAQYDVLTGLANRAVLRDRLAQALGRAGRTGRLVALLFLDLDHFKDINATLGHDVGDQLLKTVAERLRGSVRFIDAVARVGGDEFAVIAEGIGRALDAGAAAQRILDALAEPCVLNGQEVFISASIGIAISPRDGNTAETLTKNADTAMYRAKVQGPNIYRFYSPEMDASALERLSLAGGLRRAVERQDFVLYYQPQVDLRTGQVTGMEALLRWRHPELGVLPPAQFIALAEDTGLIVPMGEWVLRQACAQSRAWQAAGGRPVPVAVNLSARQFRDEAFADTVARVLDDTGLEPQHLELELTESLLMEDTQASSVLLGRLKGLGLLISVDDFGTGYSSLSYLKRFPIDRLKIDRSFVQDIFTDPDAAAIVTAIIGLGHSLRLKVIAEGVETDEQLVALCAQACDAAQGYLFCRPLPPEAVMARLQDWRQLAALQNRSFRP